MVHAEPPVLVERASHTMIITINRPEVRNAVNLAVHEAVGEALEQAEEDRDIWAVIITGAGDKSFCAGADLRALAEGKPVLPDDARKKAWGFSGFVAHPISKPTIAAVNGTALGGGFEIVLASDLVVSAEQASFGLTEVRRGIIAAGGGAFRLPQQIPMKLANELLFTGDTLTATRAHALGLVNQVVPQQRVLESAIALADRISANAPLAVQATKRIASRVQGNEAVQEKDDWARSEVEFQAIVTTQDAHEGPQAFIQKRAPVWVAR